MSDNSNGVSYPKDGNKHCFEIEENSFWFKRRNDVISLVVGWFQKPGVFADIGGGNGFVSSHLSKNHNNLKFIMIEPGLEGCENALLRGGVEVFNSTLESFREISTFENAGAFDVIEHIEDDQGFLISINKRLQLGGYLILTTPAYQLLWSPEDESAGHFRRYTIQGLKEKCVDSGFDVVFASYFFAALVPLILIYRTLLERLGVKSNSKKAHEETYLSRVLDRFLALEISLLSRKVRLPFGSSIILVAKKSKNF